MAELTKTDEAKRAEEGRVPGQEATKLDEHGKPLLSEIEERIENLPPEPEPRIQDPASTISPNTATSFGGTTPLGGPGQRTMKQAIDLARKSERARIKAKKEKEIFINLSTPLIVKTKHGELQAGPGDVVMRILGHHAVFSREAFEALGDFKFDASNYDDLLRKSLKRGVIARRLDDGNRIPMTPDQEAEADRNIEEEVANNREAREALKARKQKMVEQMTEDPENPQAWKAVDSGEGPPTATPSDTATLVPNYIPIEVLEETEPEPPPEGQDATGATAGSPGTFEPSGSTPAADLAGLQACTASPTTPWTEGQYVTLGDGSQAHWNGTAWVAGAAPAAVSGQRTPQVPKATPR